MKDPLDDIEAMLTSICNNDNADDNSGSDSEQFPNCDGNGDIDLSSAVEDANSPQAPGLDNLLDQLDGETKGSRTVCPQGKRQRSRKPEQTMASKSKKPSSKPAEKIRKPRQPKKAVSRTPAKKAAFPPLEDAPIHDSPASIIDNKDINVTTSADEADSNRFLQQMRRLAEEKLQVSSMLLLARFNLLMWTESNKRIFFVVMTCPVQAEKRKTAAIKERTIKRMQDLAAQREADMRRAAGVASKGISKGIASHKKTVPKNVDFAMAEIKVCLGQLLLIPGNDEQIFLRFPVVLIRFLTVSSPHSI